jgi:hypothetical protein
MKSTPLLIPPFGKGGKKFALPPHRVGEVGWGSASFRAEHAICLGEDSERFRTPAEYSGVRNDTAGRECGANEDGRHREMLPPYPPPLKQGGIFYADRAKITPPVVPPQSWGENGMLFD